MSAPRSVRLRLSLLLRAAPAWARTAWAGFVGSRVGGRVEIVQAAVVRDGSLLLARRGDLRGWELPGGNLEPGETDEQALSREVREETGLGVAVEGPVGVYRRTGFLPHCARVYRCRVVGGTLRPSDETPGVAWWRFDEIPADALPWCCLPIADAIRWRAGAPVCERHERQGIRAIVRAARIDLAARLRGE